MLNANLIASKVGRHGSAFDGALKNPRLSGSLSTYRRFVARIIEIVIDRESSPRRARYLILRNFCEFSCFLRRHTAALNDSLPAMREAAAGKCLTMLQ